MSSSNRKPHAAQNGRVPRIYKEAAKVLRKVLEEGGNLKTHMLAIKHPNHKGIYALVSECLRHSPAIEEVMNRTQLCNVQMDQYFAQILVTEMLWGKKTLPSGTKPLDAVIRCVSNYNLDIPREEEAERVRKPRYVRVNTLKMKTRKVIKKLKNEGWDYQEYEDHEPYKSYRKLIRKLAADQFTVDYHVKDLLVFPCGTEFHAHPLYLEGILYLQDKASCLPAFLLDPEPGSTVLDACAAPGMKTTQIAAILKNEGCVLAVDKSNNRLQTLQTMVEKSGATCIETLCTDFTSLKPEDYSHVDYVLVDPSCSGSGMTDRMDLPGHSTDDMDNRLAKLAWFQSKLLYHACQFPNIKRVVYSTCSVHREENEDVVADVLSKLQGQFQVANALEDTWPGRGSEDYEFGSQCIYARPKKDLCNGFFVAVLERIVTGDERCLGSE